MTVLSEAPEARGAVWARAEEQRAPRYQEESVVLDRGSHALTRGRLCPLPPLEWAQLQALPVRRGHSGTAVWGQERRA